MNCPATPLGGGNGMKCRKPFRPKTRKITPARYRAIVDAVLMEFLLSFMQNHGVNYIDVDIFDVVYWGKDSGFFMAQGIQGTNHVWLIMMKAMRALTRYAAAGIEETGLGLSDFGVLEVLLHKGPL